MNAIQDKELDRGKDTLMIVSNVSPQGEFWIGSGHSNNMSVGPIMKFKFCFPHIETVTLACQ